LYAIHHIPSLKVLDFQKVCNSDRNQAERLAASAAGAALEKDLQQEKTFVPGEGKSAAESFATSFTKEQKEQIRQMVANASSPAEIEEIELSVQRGIFPGSSILPGSTPTVTPPLKVNGNGSNRKRPADDEEEEEESSAKRSRVADN
jgi:U2 small nuclear ribonucleoprotein A'